MLFSISPFAMVLAVLEVSFSFNPCLFSFIKFLFYIFKSLPLSFSYEYLI